MSKKKKSLAHHLERLVKDARELVDATSDVAGDKVKHARKRLEGAIDSGGEIYDRLYENTVDRAKRAHDTVRSHPYESIGIALLVGLLLAFLMSRCGDCAPDSDEE